ncbi:hypothetical protein B0T14DRAFT_194026 [Immersiella caudata]|uniref:Uncharacterized protein n=1 Tax=Immersiella caudata TaxID=314043 RepID=A0AA39WYX5_9PEZI|nr:hypothetical protein B0T14DRAFT_194026 [Immersiella caudata]
MDPHTEAEQQRAGCPVATETTPLLPSTAPASASPSPPAPRAVLAGLWITAAGGVAVITLALSVFVAVEFHSPPIYGLPWEIKRAVFQAVLTGFIAGAWATASLWRIRRIAKLMPSLAAVPTYAALAFWLVGTSVVGAQDFFESDPCWQRYPDERKFICLHWAEKFNVLLGFYLASLLVLGYVSIVEKHRGLANALL